MAGVTLYDYQLDAINRMKIGCILCGGVGSGKSRTSLAFYYKLYDGEVNTENYVRMTEPPDLYIITTARKRDTGEWDEELAHFYMIALGMRPEQARCVLPLCLKTEIVVTANYREWRNIFKLRTPVAAHPQMRELMCPLLMELQKKIPVVFDDIYTYWPADDQTWKGSMVK